MILPDKLTLGGEIQKIFCFFSLKIAKATPQLIAAGKAGGTQMTIKFKNLSINVEDGIPNLINAGSKQTKPRIAMQAINNTNFMASSWNLNLICLGYRISRTRLPLVVKNPVLVTKAVTG